MKRIIRVTRRFIEVWRCEGFKTAVLVTKGYVLRKINLVINRGSPVSPVETNYREIYDTYLLSGQREKGPDYVELSDTKYTIIDPLVKLIAFYLPQFHPIPENDAWWGKGFTEWTNVSRAVPNFLGHYQPRLPGELGFYDLRVPDIQRRQVLLAKKYGIYGFCFHYYWFNGKRLLERPLDQFIDDPEIDFPFCICWANENWTRKWDGLAEDILIAQEHSFDYDKLIIHDLVKLFANPRYIRINNRPILIVYRANILKDAKLTLNYWRKYSTEYGTGDPYIIEVQTSGFIDPRKLGFDAAVEFPPNGVPAVPEITGHLNITNTNFKGSVFDYRQIANTMMNKPDPDYKLFKTVIPSWDNTPRRQNHSLIFTDSRPELYQSWLTRALSDTIQKRKKEERIVFINAWNEWAESAYLEPDQKFGYGYLQATLDALNGISKSSTEPRSKSAQALGGKIEKNYNTAVIIHVFYPELWEEIHAYLQNLGDEFDLYVSIPTGSDSTADLILNAYPKAVIFQCENRGRDIAPFLKILLAISLLNYSYVCKIHTKRSDYLGEGVNWRKEILNELLGSAAQINVIKQKLDHPDIGLIGPANNLISTDQFMGGNEPLLRELSQKLSIPFDGKAFNFIAGSMFWFKPAAISTILDLKLDENDFPAEQGQRDATLAHAIERFICFLADYNGYKVIQTGDFSSNLSSSFYYATPSH